MRIQCPQCSQRFDVTDEYLNKTVECGSCDNRFKVTDEEVVKEKKKFYPGEKRGADLERFGHQHSRVSGAAVDFKQAHYQPNVTADVVGPPRPRRTIAKVIGLSMMVMVILIFLLAGGKEGSMRDMGMVNRFIFVGFTAIVGGLLVIYGSVRDRKLGVMLAGLLAAILIALPFIFPPNPTVTSDEPIGKVGVEEDGRGAFNSEILRAQYLEAIGYEPVSDALESNPRESVVGIYLRNVSESARMQIGNYLYEATDRVSHETVYVRGEDDEDGLVLLTKQEKSIDEIAALCTKFGRIKKIDKKLRIVDVYVEGAKMDYMSNDKALDPKSLDFEDQNLRVLKGFDKGAQLRALNRLAAAEPKARRDDITQQLLKMLPRSKGDLRIAILHALKTWATAEKRVSHVVAPAIKEVYAEGKMDKDIMEFVIQRKIDAGSEILWKLWEKNPAEWSEMMSGLGEGAQILLLPNLAKMNVAQVVAACEILGRVGTPSAISTLESVARASSGQKKKSLKAAIDEIKKRS